MTTLHSSLAAQPITGDRSVLHMHIKPVAVIKGITSLRHDACLSAVKIRLYSQQP